MQEIISRYTIYLKSRSLAESTLEAYLHNINKFLMFCKENLNREEINLTDLTSEVIREYMVNLYNEKLTSRTIARNVSALRSFFKYLYIYENVNVNPMRKIKAPKYAKKLPVFFTPEEIFSLCDLPDLASPTGIRDKAILELFYSSGLRISELVHLKIQDIDFTGLKVSVLGKGNKRRVIPVTFIAMEFIEKYSKLRGNTNNVAAISDRHQSVGNAFIRSDSVPAISDRHPSVGNAFIRSDSVPAISDRHINVTDFFFLNNKSKPFTRMSLYFLIKKYINQIALRKGYSPHTLRHTFASHLVNNGANLLAIKEMLGHSSLSTTEIYTHLTPERIRTEFLNGHPRAGKKYKKE